MIRKPPIALVCLLALIWITRAAAVAPGTTQATTLPSSAPELTVAILDFKSDTPAAPELGHDIALILSSTLSGQPAYRIVERTALEPVLKEQEASAMGLLDTVDTGSAIKVGRGVGAKLLITGKVLTMGKDTFIAAKVIGVETTLVEGVIVKGDNGPNSDIGTMVMQLSEKLSRKITEAGPTLIAQDIAFDPLPQLKEKLKTRRLPKVAVAIAEEHFPGGLGQPAAKPVTDPAVETEMRKVLIEAGFTVIDLPEKDWPHAGVEVGITGKAFTERGGQIGRLISCTDRVEIKVTSLSDATLRVSDSDSNRSISVAENLAAKSALQKSGHILAIHLLQYFADNLPAK